VVVRAGGRVLADTPLRGRHFTLRLDLPPHELVLSVTSINGLGTRATSSVASVVGLPRTASPVARRSHEDSVHARQVRRLTEGFGATSAVYVENLVDGRGTAWNARARLPAASTLKLAIAIAVLAHEDGTPGPGTRVDWLLRRMLEESDNGAADDLEVWLAGSTSAGGRVVDELMRELGLTDTLMYGGYVRDLAVVADDDDPIELRDDDQPSLGPGKYTSARDLSGLLRALWQASAGRGPLRPHEAGFDAHDARHLLYLLAHVEDTGKLDREVRKLRGVEVLHKAGWISSARHDNGLVFWPGGVLVVTVMTYRPGGVGSSSDALAGRIAWLALRRYSTQPT
jgi:hypothetical protein